MSELDGVADRLEEEEGLVDVGPPFPQAGSDVPGFIRMPVEMGRGACRCGPEWSAAMTFREMQTDPDPEDPLGDAPEAVSVDAVVRRAFEKASRSNPEELANLGWIADDLPGWIGVHVGYGPGLPWPLSDAWERATTLLRLLPKYFAERSHRLPGDRQFVLGAAILVREVGRTLAREGLGSAAVHNEVWQAAEAAEAEARRKAA